jgi:dipeptidyl aminopeptidase/acylaminoacyl peptidase
MAHSQVSRRFFVAAMGGVSTFAIWNRAFAQTAPAVTPPPLQVYGKLPAVEKVALSPDAKRIAMIMEKNGERIVFDYDLSTGKAAAAAIAGDKLRQVMWADNSHILVVTSNTEQYYGSKYEQSYGLVLDIPAGKRIQLYANVAGVPTSIVTGDFYRIKADDGYRITASGFRQPEGIGTSEGGGTQTETIDRCLYAFGPTTGRGFKLDIDSHPVRDWIVRPDGTVAAKSVYDDDTKKWTVNVKGDKGWQTLFAIDARYDMPGLWGLGRTSQSVLVEFDGGQDAGQFYEYDFNGNRTLIELTGNENYPIYHPATYVLAGFGNSGSVETWTFYDPVMKRLPALIAEALPDQMNQVLDFAEDPRKVLVFGQGKGDAGTYYFFDFTTGDYKEIGSAYPGLPSDWVADKTYIQYKAADGLGIPAWVTLPPHREAKNCPLVVLPHGGPEAFDAGSYDWLSQAIASRGYVVLQPNYRGSAGYGKAYTASGYGEFGRKMQTDLSDGVAHLVKEDMVDPKRVSIAGGSYGGYAALAGVSLQKGIYNCAVSISGLSNLKAFLDYRGEREGFDGDSYGMLYWKRFIGDDSRLAEISPLSHVADITVPVMLIHGKDDVVVPFDQSQQIYDALKHSGKDVELVATDHEDHWLSREPSRVQTLEAMIGFLLKHNPPGGA